MKLLSSFQEIQQTSKEINTHPIGSFFVDKRK